MSAKLGFTRATGLSLLPLGAFLLGPAIAAVGPDDLPGRVLLFRASDVLAVRCARRGGCRDLQPHPRSPSGDRVDGALIRDRSARRDCLSSCRLGGRLRLISVIRGGRRSRVWAGSRTDERASPSLTPARGERGASSDEASCNETSSAGTDSQPRGLQPQTRNHAQRPGRRLTSRLPPTQPRPSVAGQKVVSPPRRS